jgi:hypothetical protein
MAAAGPWVIYNDFKFNAFKKLMDCSADTFFVALVTSASNAMSATLTPATYATLTNELATANGYTLGGVSVGAGSLTGGGATATVTFDTADATWTASGAGFTARAAVLFDNTDASKHLVAYCLLDSTPADVVTAAGNTLTLQITNVFTDA